MHLRPLKSLLFVPASRMEMAQRAAARGADAVILDLEDGVAEADKTSARGNLGSLLASLESEQVSVLVRINTLDNGGALDIAAIPHDFSPPLLIPKVAGPEQVAAVESSWLSCNRTLPTLQLLPMIECPKGLFRAEQIAAATPRVSAMIFGSEDFAAEAGLSTEIDALAVPAQWVALAAAAAGIAAYGLPGSLGNYHDMALFEATARRARTIGFSGVLCIHPNQVAVTNEAFKPSASELQWAEAVIAQAGTGGATGGASGMVDAPVLARARAIIAGSQ